MTAFAGVLGFMFGSVLLTLDLLAPGLIRLINDPGERLLSTPSLLLTLQVTKVALVLDATLFMATSEHRGVWSYGLAGGYSVRKCTAGIVCGFSIFTLLIGLLATGKYLIFDGFALHGGAVVSYALFWAFDFLLVSFYEENLLRGHIQNILARSIVFWPASTCTSVVFGLSHVSNSGENPAGIAQVIIVGLIFCAALRLTGSLWWGVGFHAAWNWAQSFIYGNLNSGLPANGHLLSSHPVGDSNFSGGGVGPEGSLICIALLLALLAWMVILLNRRSGLVVTA